jgi:ATP-dependent Clp protease protease subunit
MPDLAGEKPVYYGFTGGIDSAGATRIATAFNAAVNEGADVIHLAMSSPGGSVSDGVYLYNHIRALPVKVVAYNLGLVASIATVIFVAAGERYCSTHSAFMIHPTSFPDLPGMTAERLQTFYTAALADDERTEAILRERTGLTDNFLNARRYTDVHISPDVAVEHKIVHGIKELTIPRGFRMFQI